MSIRRKASSVWQGTGKEGMGRLTTDSRVLDNSNYSFNSRFAEGIGTNPEELIAAAHAGCFNMKLSFVLGEAGFTPEKLETTCTIVLENGKVTYSLLDLQATVKGIPVDTFKSCLLEAAQNCPISQLLRTQIRVKSVLRRA